MKIKNIVFDVGGVLLQNGTKQFVIERVTYKEDANVIERELFQSIERVQLDRGIIGKEQAFNRMLSRIPERSREEAMRIYEEYMDNRKCTKGMAELVQNLKEQGYKLYVLSNFSTDFWSIIKKNKLKFFKLFDGVFVSCFYQAVKPEREIFKLFLAKYKLQAEECVFVDDKAENVEASIRQGFNGFHFNNNAEILKQYIQDLGVSA